MTLGTGIFLSTLIVSILLLYKWTRERWNWARGFKRFFVFLVAISAITGLGFWGYDAYKNHVVKQTEYEGVKLGMSKDEVLYVKGEPDQLLTPIDYDPFSGGRNLFLDNGKPQKKVSPISTENYLDSLSDKELLHLYQQKGGKLTPQQTKALEVYRKGKYLQSTVWLYDLNIARLFITFDPKSKKVIEISCKPTEDYYGCDSLLKIAKGDTENELMDRLKKPSKSLMNGLFKMVEYQNLNLRFTLKQQEVVGMAVVDFNSKNSTHLQK